MMNAMYTHNFHAGLAPLFGLHALGMIGLSVGLILLIVWAIKTLTPAKLWTWGLGLTIGGAVFCLLSIAAAPAFRTMTFDADQMMNQNGKEGMHCMMMNDSDAKDDEETNDESANKMEMMGHSMGGMMMMMEGDAMNMSMKDMSEMLKGKTGDAFDQAFLEGMIPHHQGAIDMAKEVLKSGKHAELRELATGIIAAQQAEIDMMNTWLKEWGYTK